MECAECHEGGLDEGGFYDYAMELKVKIEDVMIYQCPRCKNIDYKFEND